MSDNIIEEIDETKRNTNRLQRISEDAANEIGNETEEESVFGGIKEIKDELRDAWEELEEEWEDFMNTPAGKKFKENSVEYLKEHGLDNPILKKVAKKAIKIAPIVGTGVDIMDAIEQYNNGNIDEAFLAAVGAIPVYGDIAQVFGEFIIFAAELHAISMAMGGDEVNLPKNLEDVWQTAKTLYTVYTSEDKDEIIAAFLEYNKNNPNKNDAGREITEEDLEKWYEMLENWEGKPLIAIDDENIEENTDGTGNGIGENNVEGTDNNEDTEGQNASEIQPEISAHNPTGSTCENAYNENVEQWVKNILQDKETYITDEQIQFFNEAYKRFEALSPEQQETFIQAMLTMQNLEGNSVEFEQLKEIMNNTLEGIAPPVAQGINGSGGITSENDNGNSEQGAVSESIYNTEAENTGESGIIGESSHTSTGYEESSSFIEVNITDHDREIAQSVINLIKNPNRNFEVSPDIEKMVKDGKITAEGLANHLKSNGLIDLASEDPKGCACGLICVNAKTNTYRATPLTQDVLVNGEPREALYRFPNDIHEANVWNMVAQIDPRHEIPKEERRFLYNQCAEIYEENTGQSVIRCNDFEKIEDFNNSQLQSSYNSISSNVPQTSRKSIEYANLSTTLKSQTGELYALTPDLYAKNMRFGMYIDKHYNESTSSQENSLHQTENSQENGNVFNPMMLNNSGNSMA